MTLHRPEPARLHPVRPTPTDLELLGEAVRALRRGVGPELHPTAAAVRTSTGAVFTALGLGDRCAEVAAVAGALAAGQRVATVVVVRHVDEDTTRVQTPCRECRDLLTLHAPAVRVLHLDDGLRVARVADLG
jgi:cytidine deaminase